MQITRERILRYLGDHPPSSAGEIGRYLEMTPANIRYHLEKLGQEGLVDVIGSRSAGGAGRPILLYSLTSSFLGESLQPLLEAFLTDLETPEGKNERLSQLAENLIGESSTGTLNRVQRFNEGVEFLNSLNYHASWEARPEGPRVVLRHCPYRDLAQSHPVLCQLDERLLQSLFGAELVLTRRRSFGKDPFSPCVFHLAGQQGEKG